MILRLLGAGYLRRKTQRGWNPHSTVLNATAKAWHQILPASEQQPRKGLSFFCSRLRLHTQAFGDRPFIQGRWELSAQLPPTRYPQGWGWGCAKPALPPSCGRLLVWSSTSCSLIQEASNTALPVLVRSRCPSEQINLEWISDGMSSSPAARAQLSDVRLLRPLSRGRFRCLQGKGLYDLSSPLFQYLLTCIVIIFFSPLYSTGIPLVAIHDGCLPSPCWPALSALNRQQTQVQVMHLTADLVVPCWL